MKLALPFQAKLANQVISEDDEYFPGLIWSVQAQIRTDQASTIFLLRKVLELKTLEEERKQVNVQPTTDDKKGTRVTREETS